MPRPPRSTLFPYTTLFRSTLSSARRLTASYPNHLWHADLTTAPTSDRKSTRLNSSHSSISYAVFCLKKKSQAKKAEDQTWRSDQLERPPPSNLHYDPTTHA